MIETFVITFFEQFFVVCQIDNHWEIYQLPIFKLIQALIELDARFIALTLFHFLLLLLLVLIQNSNDISK